MPHKTMLAMFISSSTTAGTTKDLVESRRWRGDQQFRWFYLRSTDQNHEHERGQHESCRGGVAICSAGEKCGSARRRVLASGGCAAHNDVAKLGSLTARHEPARANAWQSQRGMLDRPTDCLVHPSSHPAHNAQSNVVQGSDENGQCSNEGVACHARSDLRPEGDQVIPKKDGVE